MNEQCSGSHLPPPQLILVTRESDINLQEISRGNKGINKWEEDIKICTKNAHLIPYCSHSHFQTNLEPSQILSPCKAIS